MKTFVMICDKLIVEHDTICKIALKRGSESTYKIYLKFSDDTDTNFVFESEAEAKSALDEIYSQLKNFH